MKLLLECVTAILLQHKNDINEKTGVKVHNNHIFIFAILSFRKKKTLPENKMNIKMNICVHSIKEYCMKIL